MDRKTLRYLSLLLVLHLLLSDTLWLGNGSSGFTAFAQTTVTMAVGSLPRSVAIGDADNDGYNDIVTANAGSNNVSLIRWNGSEFDPQVTMEVVPTVGVAAGPYSVAIGNADYDWDNDIVTANAESDSVSLIHWNGSGFDLYVTMSVGDDAWSVAIGDADNDGDNDIVTANDNSSNVSLLRWNGVGFDPQVTMNVGANPVSVAIGDADNDGDNDIVTANCVANSISLLKWNGNGFDPRADRLVGTYPHSVAIADADNDGDNDILTANADSNNVSLIRWNGSGFDPQVTMMVGSSPRSVAVGDADNDGDNDIVTANRDSNNISLLLWNGITFDPQVTVSVGASPLAVAIGDADNDGDNDIVTANSGSNDVSLIEGLQGPTDTPLTPAPTDTSPTPVPTDPPPTPVPTDPPPTPVPTDPPAPTPTPLPVAVIDANLDGGCRSGNRVLIRATISPEIAWTEIKQVQFEYRPAGTEPWILIAPANPNHPNPDTSYPFFIHWDLSEMAEGDYNVRAVATTMDDYVDPNPGFVTFTVAASCGHKGGLNADGETQVVAPALQTQNTALSGGDSERPVAAEVEVPAGALLADTTLSMTFRNPADFDPSADGLSGIGHFVALILGSGQSSFSSGMAATLSFDYPDADDDGLVDGYGFPEQALGVYWLDGSHWQKLSDSQLNPVLNRVTGTTTHFTTFSVLSGQQGSTAVSSEWKSYK